MTFGRHGGVHTIGDSDGGLGSMPGHRWTRPRRPAGQSCHRTRPGDRTPARNA